MSHFRCTDLESGSIVSRSEKKRSFSIKNKRGETVNVIRVDGCLFGEGEIKCDFIFQKEGKYTCFVELKGQDVKKAVAQLEATFKAMGEEFREGIVYCIAVLSRYPRQSPAVQVYEKKFRGMGVRFRPYTDRVIIECDKLTAGAV